MKYPNRFIDCRYRSFMYWFQVNWIQRDWVLASNMVMRL